MNPNNWFTVFSFYAVVTLLGVGYGWLVKQEKLPFDSVMAYTDREFQFIRVWINVAFLATSTCYVMGMIAAVAQVYF